jgi:hypothetical protein
MNAVTRPVPRFTIYRQQAIACGEARNRVV